MKSLEYNQAAFAGSLGLPLALAAAVWVIGDQSYQGPVEGDLDRELGPVPLAAELIAVAGIGGIAGLLAAAIAVWRIRGARGTLACFAAAGVLLGFTYRTLTAGVIGANIGAGLAVVLLTPVAVLLIVVGATLAIRHRPKTGSAGETLIEPTGPTPVAAATSAAARGCGGPAPPNTPGASADGARRRSPRPARPPGARSPGG